MVCFSGARTLVSLWCQGFGEVGFLRECTRHDDIYKSFCKFLLVWMNSWMKYYCILDSEWIKSEARHNILFYLLHFRLQAPGTRLWDCGTLVTGRFYLCWEVTVAGCRPWHSPLTVSTWLVPARMILYVCGTVSLETVSKSLRFVSCVL